MQESGSRCRIRMQAPGRRLGSPGFRGLDPGSLLPRPGHPGSWRPGTRTPPADYFQGARHGLHAGGGHSSRRGAGRRPQWRGKWREEDPGNGQQQWWVRGGERGTKGCTSAAPSGWNGSAAACSNAAEWGDCRCAAKTGGSLPRGSGRQHGCDVLPGTSSSSIVRTAASTSICSTRKREEWHVCSRRRPWMHIQRGGSAPLTELHASIIVSSVCGRCTVCA